MPRKFSELTKDWPKERAEHEKPVKLSHPNPMYFSAASLHFSCVGLGIGPGSGKEPQKQEQHHERTRESEGPTVLAADVAV
jgi:hypothetical protein